VRLGLSVAGRIVYDPSTFRADGSVLWRKMEILGMMNGQDGDVAAAFVEETRAAIDQEHRRITYCLKQLDQEQVWRRPNPHVNCIGNIILHLCGNLRQWFLHGLGGEKDIRRRPEEFAATGPIRKEDLLCSLGAVIERIDALLGSVTAETLLEPRRFQGFDRSVLAAVYGTVGHLEGHSLQIAYITHMLTGEQYKPFWKPESEEQGG
jgi:hypothetical protein